ncbi:tetratricopeptide repeat protein [Thermopolyspora sp. NPDC052614]|uniref:tetratricopeptide repeat protein n=1 Tax=Thermopolyspora sp. NPDC052614 TaxID=3155682 RepID=UPI00342E6AF6
MDHLWIEGARVPLEVHAPRLLLPPVDADRGAGGPYTLGAAIARALVPAALRHRPDLVIAHDIELRTVAPDLRDAIPAARRTVADELPPAERILVHASGRTRRIANGLAEFVRDYATYLRDTRIPHDEAIRDHASSARPAARPSPPRPPAENEAVGAAGPWTIVVRNVHEADFTDRELIEVLLRRLDPALVTVIVCAPTARELLEPLATALTTRARRLPGAADGDGPAASRTGSAGHRWQGGPALPYPGDRRLDELTGEELREAVERCFEAGCHHAVAELGRRALAACEPGAEGWWRLVHRTATALASTEREEQARELLDQVRRVSLDPAEHAAAAYSTGMLLMRHHDPARRDPQEALAWVNQAIAISTLLPDPALRAFKLGFDLNGRALIEMRLGRVEDALALVERAIALADEGLAPGRHPIHRLVLRANRAQLKIMLGRFDEALGDLDAAIAADPCYPDYYIDRGNLLYRMGRAADARADYETAMRVGPPFPEPYYNRAEIRFAEGDHEGALADLGHALELDPGFADAYINRAGLLVALGEHERARADAERGLQLAPANPYLLCVLGQIEMAGGGDAAERAERARHAFDHALRRDPLLASAWANRGILAFETGDVDGAVRDLTRALELTGTDESGDTAPLLFNRAVALRAAGREREAVADLTRALELAPDDEDVRRALAVG